MRLYEIYQKEKGIIPVRFHPTPLVLGDESWKLKLKTLEEFGEKELLNNPLAFNHEANEDRNGIWDDVSVHHYRNVTEVDYHPAGKWDEI